jgi:hypothetical protein
MYRTYIKFQDVQAGSEPAQSHGGKHAWVDEEGNNKKHAHIANNSNGTLAWQLVTIKPSLSHKLLAEVMELLGKRSLIKMMQEHPEIVTLVLPISSDTNVDLWNAIQVQVSDDPWKDLQCVHMAPNNASTPTDKGPDLIFYFKSPDTDPQTATVHGTFDM